MLCLAPYWKPQHGNPFSPLHQWGESQTNVRGLGILPWDVINWPCNCGGDMFYILGTIYRASVQDSLQSYPRRGVQTNMTGHGASTLRCQCQIFFWHTAKYSFLSGLCKTGIESKHKSGCISILLEVIVCKFGNVEIWFHIWCSDLCKHGMSSNEVSIEDTVFKASQGTSNRGCGGSIPVSYKHFNTCNKNTTKLTRYAIFGHSRQNYPRGLWCEGHWAGMSGSKALARTTFFGDKRTNKQTKKKPTKVKTI